jgi:hypothetical protein
MIKDHINQLLNTAHVNFFIAAFLFLSYSFFNLFFSSSFPFFFLASSISIFSTLFLPPLTTGLGDGGAFLIIWFF